MSRLVSPAVFRQSQRAQWAHGQPISMLMSRALANPDLISLAAGFVDQQSLPAQETQEALRQLFSDPAAAQAALQYGTTPGYEPLRDLLLERMLAEDGAYGEPRPSVEQIVVTAGSNQLLHLVFESLLNPGDIVLCAAPTYLVVLGTIANLGARSIGVASDAQGMVPESLENSLLRLDATGQRERVRAVYLVPYFDNPCGVTMPADRVSKIVDIAKRWSNGTRLYVIADEAYRELRYAGDDTRSARVFDEDKDTVIVAGTFSKSYSPGIRVGWGLLPEELVEPVCSQKGNIDFGSPNFNQHLMHRILQSGLFDAHLEVIRAGYREKLDAMLSAAAEFLGPLPGVRWQRPAGGLYVWVELPTAIDAGPAGTLFDAAIRNGVLYVPGQYCFPAEGEPVQHNTIRLSFGVQTCPRIREGVSALAKAVEEVTGSS